MSCAGPKNKSEFDTPAIGIRDRSGADAESVSALLNDTLKHRLISPYLRREPPPSLPGPAPSPGSSSSSSRAWTDSTVTCLRAAPQAPKGTGTTTPLSARSGRTARWRRSAR